MRRREFIALLLATLPSLGCAEQAAADKLRLVGVLDAQREGDEAVDHEAFRQQLDKLGWTAGKNINIEYRWGAGSIDRVQAFAKELARLNPDVLVGITTPATAALQAETHTVPIVFAQVSDPVGSGFVNSLANPGGVRAYRFSISWPRIFPHGTGAPNPKGLEFYDRLLDELLANGIAPFPTLYHWDLPQPLQDRGGWENRDTADAFAQYAGYVAEKLGDRARHFFTFNECWTFVELGHATGVFAPGLKLPPGRLNQVRHHVLLAHGLAVKAIRERSPAGTQIGPAENVTICVPVIETPEHIAAAELATRELNAPYLTAIMEGSYRESFLAAAGVDAPKIAADDMSVIATPIDFVGLNVYLPGSYVRARDDAPGFVAVPFPAKFPTMNSPWLKIGPEALYWGPRNLAKVWNVSDIYITENGCSASDVPAADGLVYDTDRIMFLRSYLTQLQRATSDGVPVRGYFHWSLMDNFEWADGFSTRFGLLYVDYATQQRKPKLSASFYREIAVRNRLA